MPSACASGSVKAIDATPESCRALCATRRTRGCWPRRSGGSPLLAGGSGRSAGAAGERDAAAGRRRGRLRRAVGDLVELLAAARRIAARARERLAGRVPDGTIRRVGLRKRYDQHVSWGETANGLRDWHNSSHRGYILASRLTAKAEQIWLFTANFAIHGPTPHPNRGIKGPNDTRPSPDAGTPASPSYCRVRTYLLSSHGHGIAPVDASIAAPGR
jgi:hypothetical protein